MDQMVRNDIACNCILRRNSFSVRTHLILIAFLMILIAYLRKYAAYLGCCIFENIMENGTFARLEQMLHFP